MHQKCWKCKYIKNILHAIQTKCTHIKYNFINHWLYTLPLWKKKEKKKRLKVQTYTLLMNHILEPENIHCKSENHNGTIHPYNFPLHIALHSPSYLSISGQYLFLWEKKISREWWHLMAKNISMTINHATIP